MPALPKTRQNKFDRLLAPLPASDEGVGGGVLVPDLMTICCKST